MIFKIENQKSILISPFKQVVTATCFFYSYKLKMQRIKQLVCFNYKTLVNFFVFKFKKGKI